MNWNPKYYIVYPRKMINELKRPDDWQFICPGNLSEVLEHVLKVETGIGSEMKLIWNDWHRRSVIEDNNITSDDLDDYLRANASILSFKSKAMMNKVLKTLKGMGAVSEMVCVYSYRDVILQQACFKRTGEWITENAQ